MTPVASLDDVRAHRYKAKIDAVSPRSSRGSFEDEPECFLGVSLQNAMFSRPKLEAMLEWVSRRFDRCTVLVGDSIHRLTLQSVQGLNDDEAWCQALGLGEQFVEDACDLVEGFADRTKFEFLSCREVQEWPEYVTHHTALRRLHTRDLHFRHSVESFGRRYHERRDGDAHSVDLDRRVAMSCTYFLEEFAIFSCLRQRGISVMVYPGSFSTLTEISAGEHPRAPVPLHDLVVVSLHLKGRKR